MATMLRILVILGLKKKNYPLLLARAWAIYNAILAKPALFVTINVALILTRIQAFEEAQKQLATGAKGTASTRNLAAAALVTCLETARALVQELVDASPEQGAVIIDAAAMLMGTVKAYAKPLLKATQSQPSGAVHLVANVALLTAGTKGKVFFNWQYSSDGGKTWITAPSTPHGNTDLAGLTALETYSFRASVTDKNDTTTWSQVVTLFVR
jgi:hypothetical protein